jgi:hypothetical protein
VPQQKNIGPCFNDALQAMDLLLAKIESLKGLLNRALIEDMVGQEEFVEALRELRDAREKILKAERRFALLYVRVSSAL